MSSELVKQEPKRKRLRHPNEITEGCPVCESEHREEIDVLYIACEDIDLIAEAACLDKRDIERHAKGMELDSKRADNTEAIIRVGMNNAIDRGVLKNLDSDQFITLLKHRDAQTGKVREGNKDQRPQVIILQGIPFVAAIPSAPEEDDQPAIEGKVVAQLPASDDDNDASVPVILPGKVET